MRGSKKSKKKIVLLLLLILIAGFSLNFLFTQFIKKERITIISPIASMSKLSMFGSKSSDSLKAVVKEEIKDTDGVFGIVIKNLKTGEGYFLNEHRTFETGSLYKLWVMATLYKKLDQGVIKKEDVLEEEISILNDKFKIATESAEKTEGSIKLSIDEALEQMITVSDNYAALLLTAKVRLANVDTFLKSNGFNESKVGIKGGSPLSTAFDITMFFEKLYKGELANPEHTDEMLTLLKSQRLNNKIPKYLPKNIIVAHKTGELDPFTHDSGIVFTSKGDYIIVVLAESKNRFDTEDKIAKISKAVFDYFLRETP